MNSVTLDTLGGGALAELFAEELDRVLRNIADPNTDPRAGRRIALQVDFLPNEDRDVADVHLRCTSKLAGIKTVHTQVFMGRKDGRLMAVEHNPRQSSLFDDPAPPALAAVAPFKGREK